MEYRQDDSLSSLDLASLGPVTEGHDRVQAERAVLVQLETQGIEFEPSFAEFRELVQSAGLAAVAEVRGGQRQRDAKFFAGSGKAQEIQEIVAQAHADVVLVNHELSPAQERNLEQLTRCRVVDRIGLILDIFAQRAQTHEGKLQVELAQLKYLSTRLVRGWTHLERQKGGIGLRGPGETQLETDRRLIGQRIRRIQSRLESVGKRRALNRRARRKAGAIVVSLVGYTNAGKSTLFNALTRGGAEAADKLFATLDPTLRKIEFEGAPEAILVDTVGFIRDLPLDLVAAFRATLEETQESTMLLHVVDAGAAEREQHEAQVQAVLGSIGADQVPQLVVMNKIDTLAASEDGCVASMPSGGSMAGRVDCDEAGQPTRVWVSALDGAGIEALRDAMAQLLRAEFQQLTLKIPASAGRLRARLFERAQVLDEQYDNEGFWHVRVTVDPGTLESLTKSEGFTVGELLSH